MRKRYRRYRGYGHGRFVSATLAPSPALFYGLCIIGGIAGVVISAAIR